MHHAHRLEVEQRRVMVITIFGDTDPWTLRTLAERLRDQLRNEPEITQVSMWRVPDYVTHVEISQDVLRQYGMTLPDVASLIRRSSDDIPAGAVETKSGEILLRLDQDPPQVHSTPCAGWQDPGRFA